MTKPTNKGGQQTIPPGKEYFTEKEVADRLSMSRKWLQKMRNTGGGIKFLKIGKAVRYSANDILLFEERSKRISTSDDGSCADPNNGKCFYPDYEKDAEH